MLTERIERLDASVRRLEVEVNRSPVRGVVGSQGGEGIESFVIFPAIPNDEPRLIRLVSSRKTHIWIRPLDWVPSKLDTYWYAVPGDSRWHPTGGKLSRLSGEPGTISATLEPLEPE